ncbi:hypothetical protein OG239_16115 [Streptomyces sp. NBC_00868]|uniref:hypothetical protein n=1 Tax=Streptomyces sp. NBC_00868 TaxID=2903683 RepID=UPI00387070C5|nr:hypothetical protein OG239_16115 [Streptomyces sp. NBC_00868]
MTASEPTRAEYLDAAQEMAHTGHATLARLLAEEAADRTDDPVTAAAILRRFNGRAPSERSEY